MLKWKRRYYKQLYAKRLKNWILNANGQIPSETQVTEAHSRKDR